MGLSVAASFGMNVVCPNTLDDVLGTGLSVCMPTISFMGANPWPEFCFNKGIVKNHHHRDSPAISNDDKSYTPGGYSLGFGWVGLKLEVDLLGVFTGTMTETQSSNIVLGSSGVRGGGQNRPPYSLEWMIYWIYVFGAVFISYQFFKKNSRLQKAFSNSCGRRAAAGNPSNQGNRGADTELPSRILEPDIPRFNNPLETQAFIPEAVVISIENNNNYNNNNNNNIAERGVIDWKCPRCTLDNEPTTSLGICKACGYKILTGK